jgi:hypothetical protein
MDDKRKSIIEKIRNLRAKAEGKGATEAEAMEAASMVARLMVRNQVTEKELEDTQKDGATTAAYKSGRVLHPVLEGTGVAIGALTETRAYVEDGALHFIGLDEDVEMATYLSEMFVGYAKRAWRDYFESHKVKAKDAMKMRDSLMHGMASRLTERMNDLIIERREARAAAKAESNTTALVVLKDQLIKDKMKEMGLNLVTRKRKTQRLDAGAFGSGRSAADRVNLRRPFGDGTGAGDLIA